MNGRGQFIVGRKYKEPETGHVYYITSIHRNYVDYAGGKYPNNRTKVHKSVWVKWLELKMLVPLQSNIHFNKQIIKNGSTIND